MRVNWTAAVVVALMVAIPAGVYALTIWAAR